jgi:hypothetical protein
VGIKITKKLTQGDELMMVLLLMTSQHKQNLQIVLLRWLAQTLNLCRKEKG